MVKKTFTQAGRNVITGGGLDTILGNQSQEVKQAKTEKNTELPDNTAVRATFYVSGKTLEKIRCIAYWDRKSIKDIVNHAFDEMIVNYEKTHGKIKPIKK